MTKKASKGWISQYVLLCTLACTVSIGKDASAQTPDEPANDQACMNAHQINKFQFRIPEGGKKVPIGSTHERLFLTFQLLLEDSYTAGLGAKDMSAPLGTWYIDLTKLTVEQWDYCVDQFLTSVRPLQGELIDYATSIWNGLASLDPNEKLMDTIISALYRKKESEEIEEIQQNLISILDKSSSDDIRYELLFGIWSAVQIERSADFLEAWLNSLSSGRDDTTKMIDQLFRKHRDFLLNGQHDATASSWAEADNAFAEGAFVLGDADHFDDHVRTVHIGFSREKTTQKFKSMNLKVRKDKQYLMVLPDLIMMQLLTKPNLQSTIITKLLEAYEENPPETLNKWAALALLTFRSELVAANAKDQELRRKIVTGVFEGFRSSFAFENACIGFFNIQLAKAGLIKPSTVYALDQAISSGSFENKLILTYAAVALTSLNEPQDLASHSSLHAIVLRRALGLDDKTLQDIYTDILPSTKYFSSRENLAILQRIGKNQTDAANLAAESLETLKNSDSFEFVPWTNEELEYLRSLRTNPYPLGTYAKALIALSNEKTDEDLLLLATLADEQPTEGNRTAKRIFSVWLNQNKAFDRFFALAVRPNGLDLNVVEQMLKLVRSGLSSRIDFWHDAKHTSHWMNHATDAQLVALKPMLHELISTSPSTDERDQILKDLAANVEAHAKEIRRAEKEEGLSQGAWDALNAVAVLHSYENIPGIRTKQTKESAEKGFAWGHPACRRFIPIKIVRPQNKAGTSSTPVMAASPLTLAIENEMLPYISTLLTRDGAVRNLSDDEFHDIVWLTGQGGPIAAGIKGLLARDSDMSRLVGLIASHNASAVNTGFELLTMRKGINPADVKDLFVTRFNRNTGEMRPVQREKLRSLFFHVLREKNYQLDGKDFDDYFAILKSFDFYAEVTAPKKLLPLLSWLRQAPPEQSQRLIAYVREQLAAKDFAYEETRRKILGAVLNLIEQVTDRTPVRGILAAFLAEEPNIDPAMLKGHIDEALSKQFATLQPHIVSFMQSVLPSLSQRRGPMFTALNFQHMQAHFSYQKGFLAGDIDGTMHRLKERVLNRESIDLDKRRQDIEEYAIAHVMVEELKAGRFPTDVGAAGELAHDVRSYDRRENKVRFIEVKGKTLRDGLLTVSFNETNKAETYPDRYYLYVVDLFMDSGKTALNKYVSVNWPLVKAISREDVDRVRQEGTYQRDLLKPYRLHE